MGQSEEDLRREVANIENLCRQGEREDNLNAHRRDLLARQDIFQRRAAIGRCLSRDAASNLRERDHKDFVERVEAWVPAAEVVGESSETNSESAFATVS